ncbi:KaiC domain-containing protein [Halorubrum amylolyticum]|uniref:KaiC domain-containing protein n=1 Tax=Halorubrum amylolyticum TaxID=2508724 RepID=UPI001008CAA4|nr:KaiC domain-containing protein [Halorubrum amylolyticum]
MSEEDDWFERALRDADADSRAADDGGDDEAGDDRPDENGEADDDRPDENGEADDDRPDENGEAGDKDEVEGTPESEGGDAPDEEHGSDPFGGIREGERDPSRDPGDGEAGETGETGETSETGDEAGSDPFGGGSPDDGAPAPTGSADAFDGSFGDGDPFGGGSGGDEAPNDRRSPGGGDPFGGYRENAAGDSGGPSESGGPDDVGFGEFGDGEGGDASPGFDVDPDEFESSIERTDIGIEGLDEMILGGVPRRSLLSVIGGAGTGKTTFALQFLNEALESDRKGIYITLEQTRESILSTAEEKGWSFREHADEDRLAVVAIDPIEMANSLASIRNDLTRLIAEFDADRLVLDSVSLLEMMYDHPAKRRSEVFGFTRSLKEAGVTTLLTSEASEENAYASRHGIVEYLTDAVFVLQYIRGTDFRETRLAVEIQKIRDANHSRQSKPYEITDTGISVYGQANIF